MPWSLLGPEDGPVARAAGLSLNMKGLVASGLPGPSPFVVSPGGTTVLVMVTCQHSGGMWLKKKTQPR